MLRLTAIVWVPVAGLGTVVVIKMMMGVFIRVVMVVWGAILSCPYGRKGPRLLGCGKAEGERGPQGVWWMGREDTRDRGNSWVCERECPQGQAKTGRKRGEARLQILKIVKEYS
jgi:hypothetical protein